MHNLKMAQGNTTSKPGNNHSNSLDYEVGPKGIHGDLYQAGVTARTSPDHVTARYDGRTYFLDSAKGLMALSSDLRNPSLRRDRKTVKVSVSAVGPTAPVTLETVCYLLFTPAEEQELNAAEAQKKDA
jgi:hypothetical protein